MSATEVVNNLLVSAVVSMIELSGDAPRKLVAANSLFYRYETALKSGNEQEALINFRAYEVMEDTCIEHRMGARR